MRAFFFSLAILLSVAALADRWYCPMHCEGEKTYDVKRDCPVCGMHLEKVKEGEKVRPLNSREYRVDLTASPKATQKTTLNFTPHRTRDDSVLKELDGGMSTVIVSQDLSFFSRNSLSSQPNGSWNLDFTFPAGGNYIAFAQLKTKGEDDQIFPLAIKVDGTPAKTTALKTRLTWKSGKHTASLKVPAKIKAGETVELTLQLPKSAVKYAVAVSEDTAQFVSPHAGHDGRGSIFAAFPKPGLYKLWVQVEVTGQLLTSDFVVSVI